MSNLSKYDNDNFFLKKTYKQTLAHKHNIFIETRQTNI